MWSYVSNRPSFRRNGLSRQAAKRMLAKSESSGFEFWICTYWWLVAFARLASYFLLLSQKKVTKEKATPSRLFPALLILMGSNRKLAQ